MDAGNGHVAGRREGRLKGPPESMGSARTLGAWLLVFAAAAFSLRLADALPRAALGLPRGVVRAAGMAELERAAGRRMPLPAYYPDTLEWPPAETRMHTGGSMAVWCRQRPGGPVALIVATAPPGSGGVAAALLPRSVELQREETSLGTRRALVSRLRDADGALWQQTEWQAGGQIILVRYRGTLDELLRIAGSVHE